VTLSGCTTAAGQDTGGALLAFQAALLVAGARHVVSSLWPIGDEATVQLMKIFYDAVASGMPPAVALRHTQCTLLTNPSYNHPAIWAAFACYRR
jgi:CHAT domain-containing protein